MHVRRRASMLICSAFTYLGHGPVLVVQHGHELLAQLGALARQQSAQAEARLQTELVADVDHTLQKEKNNQLAAVSMVAEQT